MGRGGGEGRVPNLMTAAVEREVSDSHFFSFFFDVQSMASFASKKAGPGQTKPPTGGSLCDYRKKKGPGRKGLKHLHTRARG
jgi:hypothetical protein